MKKFAVIASSIYVAFTIAGFFVSTFLIKNRREVGELENGCFWTDKLIAYVQCNGAFDLLINEYFLQAWMLPLFVFFYKGLIDWRIGLIPILHWIPSGIVAFYGVVQLKRKCAKKI